MLMLMFHGGGVCAEPSPLRRVLIVNEVGASYPAINHVDEGIRESLQTSPYQIEFYREYLDMLLFPRPADQEHIRESLVRKYQNRRPDVIVTVGSSALEFIAETHQQAFPGIPVVFCMSNNLEERVDLGPDFTGVEGTVSADATVRAALALLPNTQHVFVVAGSGEYDKQKLSAITQQLSSYEGRAEITYLTDLKMPMLLERLKRLPTNSIVLLASVGQDAAGMHFTSSQTGPMVSSAANAPVFSLLDLYLGHGEVGGKVSSVVEQGRIAGSMALSILNGAKPQDIATPNAPNSYVFDWRAIKRWHLSLGNIPPGSVVLNRERSVWAQYKWYIVVLGALVLVQTLLIVGLVFQRRRRRVAEIQVRESEERFRRLANTAPVMIWQSGPDKLCDYFNQQWLDFTGRPLEYELRNGWAEGVHTHDLKSCIDTYTRAFDQREHFQIQYRLRRRDGEYRWIVNRGVPRYNVDGSFAGYIGSCVDVTDRKLAEEALTSVGRKLIEAHEEERSRMGRELHDGVGQHLALLSIKLSHLENKLPPKPELHNHVLELQEHVRRTTDEVRNLSHHLHSSELEYLGLAVAVESFCHEIAEQQDLEIDFRQDAIADRVPKELSLCLFRVLQESLRNAVKHSHARQLTVQLQGIPGYVQLTVSDSGVGFDEAQVFAHPGLGLISMRERVQMVGGDFSISSRPGHGTTIFARVPLAQRAQVA